MTNKPKKGDIEKQEKIVELLYEFSEAQRYCSEDLEERYIDKECSSIIRRINRKAVGKTLEEILKLFGLKVIPID
jgi:hypothetical protein